jgi:WD40 repeat protein
MHTHQSTLRADVSADGRVVAAGAGDGTLSIARLAEHIGETSHDHTALISNLRFLPSGSLVTTGEDGRAFIWRADSLAIEHRLEHLPSIEGIGVVHGGQELLLAGVDGRLLRWSPDRDVVDVLFASKFPLENVETLATDDTVLVSDTTGSVWHVLDKNRSNLLRRAGADFVRVVRVSPDARFVAVATSAGDVTIFESTNWTVVQTIKMDGDVRQVAFSRDGDLLALASDGPHVRLLPVGASRSDVWQDRSLDVRSLSFSPDGHVLALVCTDGSAWLHSLRNDAWAYVRDHYAFTASGHFSSDGRLFVVSDNDGVVTVRDVDETLRRSLGY